jgi:uncharacterized membrane protein YdbT with pleckstrin-like domain
VHYDSHPAWQYQWSAVLAIAVTLAVSLWTLVYGPHYLGARNAHLAISATGAIALYFVLLMLYRRFAWRYLIDDQNIESYQGVLARHVRSIRLEDLRNINVNQSVMQRLFGVGDVEFSSAGGDGIEVVFFGVIDPMAVKALAQKYQNGARAPSP